MSKKNNFPMNVGMSSILLIFVVLCLASFGILSIVSANADRKLSLKVMNRSVAYYNACNQAEECIKDIDHQLHSIYTSSKNEDDYLSQVSLLDNNFYYTLSDLQKLQVTLSYYPYPDSAEDPLYQITSWKVINTENIEYDNQLHVIP